jgi:hypothetical protein
MVAREDNRSERKRRGFFIGVRASNARDGGAF